jgi:hypothetical protein
MMHGEHAVVALGHRGDRDVFRQLQAIRSIDALVSKCHGWLPSMWCDKRAATSTPSRVVERNEDLSLRGTVPSVAEAGGTSE